MAKPSIDDLIKQARESANTTIGQYGQAHYTDGFRTFVVRVIPIRGQFEGYGRLQFRYCGLTVSRGIFEQRLSVP